MWYESNCEQMAMFVEGKIITKKKEDGKKYCS